MHIKHLAFAIVSLIVLSACVGPDTTTMATQRTSADALWPNQSNSLKDMFDSSDFVVVAQVIEVAPGRVIQPLPEQPKKEGNTEIPKTYFTNVTIRVIENLGKSALPSEELMISLPGGESTPFFEDNPPYTKNEVYLLFLKRSPLERNGSASQEPTEYVYHIIHPQGRYRVEGGELVTLTNNYALNRELHGDSLEDVKTTLATYQ